MNAYLEEYKEELWQGYLSWSLSSLIYEKKKIIARLNDIKEAIKGKEQTPRWEGVVAGGLRQTHLRELRKDKIEIETKLCVLNKVIETKKKKKTNLKVCIIAFCMGFVLLNGAKGEMKKTDTRTYDASRPTTSSVQEAGKEESLLSQMDKDVSKAIEAASDRFWEKVDKLIEDYKKQVQENKENYEPFVNPTVPTR